MPKKMSHASIGLHILIYQEFRVMIFVKYCDKHLMDVNTIL